MKKIMMLLSLLVLVGLIGCGNQGQAVDAEGVEEQVLIKVGVSIPPQATMVEAVGGDFVEVVTLIPPGNSPANYAPTQKEMAALSESQLYFSIDVPTERVNIIPLIEDGNYDMEVIDLAEKVDAVYPPLYFSEHSLEEHEDHDHDHDHEHEYDTHEHEEHSHEGRDPHMWLSTSRVIVMVEEIEEALSQQSPENKAVFEANAKAYIEQLEDVDQDLETLFKDVDEKVFLIYHPSLGYFAEEYGLQMIALESEGKAATVQGMTEVIEFARSHGIKRVFYQEEFDAKQAQLLAGEIDGEAVQLSPLSKSLVDNLRKMGNELKMSMK